jgi:putative ABC transport system permease protein
VLTFTLIAAMTAGLVSGLAPARHVYRESLGGSLGDASRGSSRGRSAGRLRDAVIVIQVALAIVLLSGAGLLIRGFVRLQAQDKGFRDEGIASFRVALGWKRYSGEAVARYYERAVEKLAAIPGVERVGFIYSPPLSALTFSAPNTVRAEGQPLDEALRNPYVNPQSTSDEYFAVMEIPLLAGRSFSSFDRKDSEPVAIVSERLARMLWPGQNALRRRIQYNPLLVDPNNVYRTVVGIVGNVQHREVGGEPSLDLYVPFRQTRQANQFMLAKTRLPLAEFQRRAEEALWSIDPEQSLFDFHTYEERVFASIWQLRVSRFLLALFGGVAIVLSAVGMYGVMSYLVGQRTREMGIRLALGATPADLWTLVVGRGALLSLIGSTLGLAGSLALGQWLAHHLRGVASADPVGSGIAFVVLLAVSIAACAIPARRASRNDPAMTLRSE